MKRLLHRKLLDTASSVQIEKKIFTIKALHINPQSGWDPVVSL